MLRHFLYYWLKLKTSNYWKFQEIPFEIQQQYAKQKEDIEKIYAKIKYWHGTGRYHYKVNDKSKYEGHIESSKIEDVLTSILQSQSLTPYLDEWAMSDNKYTNSISTTKWKMYARSYAELHSTEDTIPFVTFGKKKDIIRFVLAYTLASIPFLAGLKLYKAANFNPKYQSKIPDWLSTINNSYKTTGSAFKDASIIASNYYSNISGNYGLLLGISAENMKESEISPLYSIFESRFTNSIKLVNITHIEVTSSKVDEVKTLLVKNNVAIPVFSLEVCELYYSKLSHDKWFDQQNKGKQILPKVNFRKLYQYYKKGYR